MLEGLEINPEKKLGSQLQIIERILKGRALFLEEKTSKGARLVVKGCRGRVLEVISDDPSIAPQQKIGISASFNGKPVGGSGVIMSKIKYKPKGIEDMTCFIEDYIKGVMSVINRFMKEQIATHSYENELPIDRYIEKMQEDLEANSININIIEMINSFIYCGDEGMLDEGMLDDSIYNIFALRDYLRDLVPQLIKKLKEEVIKNSSEYKDVIKPQYKAKILLKENPNIYYKDRVDWDDIHEYNNRLEGLLDKYTEESYLPKKEDFIKEVKETLKERKIFPAVSQVIISYLEDNFKDSFEDEFYQEFHDEVFDYIKGLPYSDIDEKIRECLGSQIKKPNILDIKKEEELLMPDTTEMTYTEVQQAKDAYYEDSTLTFKVGDPLSCVFYSSTKIQKDYSVGIDNAKTFQHKEKKGLSYKPHEIISKGYLFEYKDLEKPKEDHSYLDYFQNFALYNALLKEDGKLKNPILFIDGGPGSGKTTVVKEIIKQHIDAGRQVLLLGSSNPSVQVPALKVRKEGVGIHLANNDPSVVLPGLQKSRTMRGISDSGKNNLDYLEKKHKRVEKVLKDMKYGGVMFSTFGTAITDEFVGQLEPDVVIIDEATKMSTPEMILGLLKAKKQIIFVGDPRQLGNMKLDRDEREFLVKYMTEKMQMERSQIDLELDSYEQGPFTLLLNGFNKPGDHLPYVYLNYNRRSKNNIVKVLSELHYKGKMLVGREDGEVMDKNNLTFFDTSSLESGESSVGKSKKNPKEAKIIVSRIIKKLKDGVDPRDIGIIATYKSQAHTIRQILRRKIANDKRLRKKITEKEIERMFDSNNLIHKQKSLREQIFKYLDPHFLIYGKRKRQVIILKTIKIVNMKRLPRIPQRIS